MSDANKKPTDTDELTSALGALKGLLAEQGVNLSEADEDEEIPTLTATSDDDADVPLLQPNQPASFASEEDDIPTLSSDNDQDDDDIPVLGNTASTTSTASTAANSEATNRSLETDDDDIPTLGAGTLDELDDNVPELTSAVKEKAAADDLDLDKILEEHSNNAASGCEFGQLREEILEDFAQRIDAVLAQTRRKLMDQLEAQLDILQNKLK